jgi:hypothetical protein
MARGLLKLHGSRRNAMIKTAHQHRVSGGSPNNGAPIHAMSSRAVPSLGTPRQTWSAPQHPSLTPEQVFRLWRCAIKDDEELVDELIERLYENIVAFDCKRAESVIALIVRRSLSARWAFRSLLKDMRAE